MLLFSHVFGINYLTQTEVKTTIIILNIINNSERICFNNSHSSKYELETSLNKSVLRNNRKIFDLI